MSIWLDPSEYGWSYSILCSRRKINSIYASNLLLIRHEDCWEASIVQAKHTGKCTFPVFPLDRTSAPSLDFTIKRAHFPTVRIAPLIITGRTSTSSSLKCIKEFEGKLLRMRIGAGAGGWLCYCGTQIIERNIDQFDDLTNLLPCLQQLLTGN
jgi:hypothetical protein